MKWSSITVIDEGTNWGLHQHMVASMVWPEFESSHTHCPSAKTGLRFQRFLPSLAWATPWKIPWFRQGPALLPESNWRESQARLFDSALDSRALWSIKAWRNRHVITRHRINITYDRKVSLQTWRRPRFPGRSWLSSPLTKGWCSRAIVLHCTKYKGIAKRVSLIPTQKPSEILA